MSELRELISGHTKNRTRKGRLISDKKHKGTAYEAFVHTDIDITLLPCVSLINLVAVPKMYPPLIYKIEHGSSHQIPCDGTHVM